MSIHLYVNNKTSLEATFSNSHKFRLLRWNMLHVNCSNCHPGDRQNYSSCCHQIHVLQLALSGRALSSFKPYSVMFLLKKYLKALSVSTVNFLSVLQVIVSSPDQLSAVMAGGEPVWLPEIPCSWLKISPCKCNCIHSWPKDNVSLTAPSLLVQMDFRENKFSPDWDQFSVFHCENSEIFSFLHPCFWGRESLCWGCCFLLVTKMCSSVNFCALLALPHNLSILHRSDTSPPKSSKEQVSLPQEPLWKNS